MLPIFMGPMPRGPQVINSTVTIRQSGGGLGQFLMGLFGGYTGTMPGMYPMMGYRGPLGYVSPREQMQFNYYFQQMQMQRQFAMMNQQNQYAYLNQMQMQQPVQALPGTDNNTSEQSVEMTNLETFFKGKGYIILPESDGNYTVADKDGNLLAKGSYKEVRDKLFEINKKEIEESEEIEEEDELGDEEDEIPERSQKIPSGWHKATADGYKYLKNVDVDAVNKEAKKEGQSAARFVVSHFYLPTRFHGCLSMKQIDALTERIISNNTDCFNEDGSFKEGFSSDNLALPNTKWVAKNILGDESITPAKRQETVKKYMSNSNPHAKELKELQAKYDSCTNEDEREKIQAKIKQLKNCMNTQYHANVMAQKNCRETKCKDVYYNEQSKTHFYMYHETDDETQKETVTIVAIPEVKVVNQTGSWVDKKGKTHSRDELIALAETKREHIETEKPDKSQTTVPDDDGISDNTRIFEEIDD